MAGKGTTHHKLHSYTGIGMIISLPFVLFGLSKALPDKVDGLTSWLSAPFGAVSLLVFLTAAIWYCKLEFDDVVMDYFGGGLRKFCLLANRIVGFVIWAVSVYAILKIWLGL